MTTTTVIHELCITRDEFSSKTTLGKFFVDDLYFAETLEDRDRGLDSSMTEEEILRIKIKKETAIPVGRYRVAFTYSQRLKRTLPILLDVKGFQGIRMHKGNTNVDTEGCPIVGSTRGVDAVYQSTSKELELCKRIREWIEKGDEVYITIERAPDAQLYSE